MSSLFSAVQWPFGIAVGTGVGAAAAGAITPGIQEVVNEAWATHPVKPPGAGLLAAGVAEGHITRAQALGWAHQTGFGDAQFDAMIAIAREGPGVPRAFELWRRGAIEDEWTNGLVALHDVLLSPSELANARQQGFVDQSRQYAEAALQGVTNERAEIQFQLSGLPPGPETMQLAVTRGVADRATFDQAIREGHTKTKYTELLFELRMHVLSATQWATAWLKGHATEAQAKAGGAAVGYGPAEMDLLYLNQGRPATPRQIHLGYARGSSLPA